MGYKYRILDAGEDLCIKGELKRILQRKMSVEKL